MFIATLSGLPQSNVIEHLGREGTARTPGRWVGRLECQLPVNPRKDFAMPTDNKNQGGSHEQHVKAGQQSHKNDDKNGNKSSGGASGSGSSGSNQGGTKKS